MNGGDSGPHRGYALCATQRSGSNYACELLASTGKLGRPLDYFNAEGRRDKGWLDYPDSYDEQLDVVLRHGATPNGVYGFKLFPQHLLGIAASTERLPGLRWIHVRRTDALGQAISLVLAEQTGRWRSTAPPRGEAVYDRGAIDRAIHTLAHDDAQLRQFFARSGIVPLDTTYEAIVERPDAFVRDVSAWLGVVGSVAVDPSAITVAMQRDAVNDAWRRRYLDETAAAPTFSFAPLTHRARATNEAARASRPSRPRVSVHVLTRDGEQRLPRLIAEARSYADEVVVGVDASSADASFDVAAAHADVAYRFALPRPAQLAPARMLAFEYASGDWILSLDDDESMEPGFESLLPELVRAPHVTHYYFPRKWIVSEHPPLYAHADPWFPNWAPRLFVNDRALFWKPPQPHSMYFIEGPSAYEERCAILHFEPVWCAPDERERKLHAYRAAGAGAGAEAHYAAVNDAPRRPVAIRPPATPPRAAGLVHETPRVLTASSTPPWRAEIVHVDLPTELRPGAHATVAVIVRNTGELAWMPTYAQWPANPWPLLRLSHHVHSEDGTPIGGEDRPRSEVRRAVRPGEAIRFVDTFPAPPERGDYVVEWDMLSEGHLWFAACGSRTYRHRIRVR